MYRLFIINVILVFPLFTAVKTFAQKLSNQPNIVVILADDLGYGDLSSYGATEVSTPNIDRLAREGMRFTHAYSPSSVCTPTRYALLTGRYAWRTWSGTTTLWADEPLLIDTARLTLPKLLQQVGYQTSIIGKWHLGFGAPGVPGWDDIKGPNYNLDLKPGPLEVGFDYFFGVPHVGQFPHIFIENHRIVNLDPQDPIEIVLDPRWQEEKVSYLQRLEGNPKHRFTGGRAAKYENEDLAVRLTEKAVEWIEQQQQEPFFLYFAHRNVHGPLRPHERFVGTSEIGVYGDFINELDWSVGEILDALDRKGFLDNTLILFSSDNGGVEDYKPSKFIEINGHPVNGPYFGQKTEVYEGGVHVPFIVRWPNVVEAGTRSDALITLNDLIATSADLLNVSLPWNAGEDSFSFLPVLTSSGSSDPERQNVVLDSYQGLFAIRQGPWKLITGQGGGGYRASEIALKPDQPPMQLYNLRSDPQETTNLYKKYPELVARMKWKLKKIQYSGRSR